MHNRHSDTERDAAVEQVIALYLEAAATGTPIDRTELLAQHPELAENLRVFFADHDEVRQWAEPLRQSAEVTPTPRSELPTMELGRSAAGAAAAEIDSVFGDYETLAEIAHGGMGVVYKARQVSLDRVVALKMIRAGQLADAADVQRFHAEAHAAAHLDHPNIVPIYDVGVDAGRHFFTMKYIEGGSLAVDRRSTSADLRSAAKQVATVARAVHYAHQRGILHRDLKPANILVDAAGVPHVTDFGLAKRLTTDTRITQPGAIVGTPSYMAPEQAGGRPDLSTAADVYSLGAILYELLTGQPPFRAASVMETLVQVLEREPARPRSLNPRLPLDLETICLKCLAKDPARRYGSAEALADDLERWLAGEPIQARRTGWVEWAVKWARRRPAAAALVALLIATPLAVVAVGMVYNVQLEQALQNAREADEAAQTNAAAAQEANRDAQGLRAQARQAKLDAAALLEQGEGLRLIGESRAVLADNPTLALLLAIQGAKHGTRAAPHNNALAAAMIACRERAPLLRPNNPRHGSLVSAACLGDGSRVLTTSQWGLAVWDRRTGKRLLQWHGPVELDIAASGVSPDGRLAVVTFVGYSLGIFPGRPHIRRILFTDHVARVIDTVTGKETVLKGHAHRLASAQFSPDSRRVVTASWDGTARIWNAATGECLHVLKGHACALAAAGFSADGKKVFTLASGKTHAQISGGTWRPDKDAVDLPVPPEPADVKDNQASPGYNATPVASDFARIWDAASGKEEQVLHMPDQSGGDNWPFRDQRVPQAALSPDGKRLAAVHGATYWLWDLGSGNARRLETPPVQTNYPCLAPVFSHDGKLLMTSRGRISESVSVFETATGKRVALLAGHEQPITGMRFLAGGDVLTVSLDKTCRYWWNPTDLVQELVTLRGHEHDILSMDVSRGDNKREVVTASADGSVHFWDLMGDLPSLGKPLAAGAGTTAAAVSPDSRLAVTGTANGTLWLWDPAHNADRPFTSWRGHAALEDNPRRNSLTGAIMDVSFSPDGVKVLTASSDGNGYVEAADGTRKPLPYTPVRVWDVQTGKELALKGGHDGGVRGARFSPDGRRVLTVADALYPMLIWRADGGVHSFGGTGTDRTARIWDAATGKELLVLHGKWNEIGAAVWNHDGGRVCTVHEDGARIWDAARGKELLRLGEKTLMNTALFSGDGKRLLTWTSPDLVPWANRQGTPTTADLWDAETGVHVATLTGHQTPIGHAAASPDGRLIATTAPGFDRGTRWYDPQKWGVRTEDSHLRDRTARIWHAQTGKPLMVLHGHVHAVRSARFSRDSKWLVTTSDDRTARIWDLSTGKEFLTLKGHADGVKAAEFTADGKQVVTVSWDGTARLWPVDPLPLALERKPRELTAEERARFDVER